MKATKLYSFFLAVIFLCATPLAALLSDYTFTQSVTTYNEITGGSVYGTETSDDQRFVDPAVPAGGTTNLWSSDVSVQ